MFDLCHRTFPLHIAIVAVATLLLLGIATESRAATDAQCSTEWSESDADDTCSGEQISALSGNRCWIRAQCSHANGAVNPDSIKLPLSLVDNLKNCGGWLTLGSC